MKATVREGYRRARLITRSHAKSFYFASALLFGARRRATFALYAFCRHLDDVVDNGPGELLAERLHQARAVVASLYASPAEVGEASSGGPWHPAEMAALQDTVRHFRIPEAPFLDLLLGMEMETRTRRYTRFSELDRYCYCVAGTVGLMLCPVLGVRDIRALPAAADLGRAMQLTNILRDVKEDLERDRVYLPQDELAAFGLTEADLRSGQVDDRIRAFFRSQITRARALYARAALGIGYLEGFGTQRMVRLMGALYSAILVAIERQDYDVFSARARVSWAWKLRLAARALLRPKTLLTADATEVRIPLLPTETPP